MDGCEELVVEGEVETLRWFSFDAEKLERDASGSLDAEFRGCKFGGLEMAWLLGAG